MINESGFQKTEVGIIPNDWSVSCVGNEFDVKLGKMLDSEKNIGVPKFYLGNKSVQWNRIDTTDLQVMLIPQNELERFRLQVGDLLVCEGGEVGRAAIWENQIDECYFQKALHRLRPKNKFNIRLMLAFLHYWSVHNKLSDYVSQTSIAHLTREKFLTVPLLVPPKDEQTAIANALNDADELITRLEKLIAKKRDIKQGAMQELLKPKDDWEVKKLGEMEFDISDGNYSSKYPKASEFISIGIPFIRANNIRKMTIINDDMRFISPRLHSELLKGHLKDGDILITTRGEIGNIALVPKSHIGSNINAQIVRINTENKLDNLYFAYFLIKKETQEFFFDNQTGSALKQLPVGVLRDLSISFPKSETEQTRIAQILSDMDAEIEALEKKLAKYKMLKQGMMQNLLTGKIRLVKSEK
jgi:type I restriction enzyme, S subunit